MTKSQKRRENKINKRNLRKPKTQVRKGNGSKPMESRFTITMNDNLGFMGGMFPISLEEIDEYSNRGKEIMVSRGLDTDLKTVEQLIVELTVETNSMDELTSHLHLTTGRLDGGIHCSNGKDHYPFYGFTKDCITGEDEELTSEKMDEIFRNFLLVPVMCYYWKLKKEDTIDPTHDHVHGGNKGEIDHMIKIHTIDDPNIEGVIFGNSRYRRNLSGQVVPYVMKTVQFNERTKSKLCF